MGLSRLRLAGLVLAAGQSRRFGGDKRIAKFDNTYTLLQQSISLIESHCSLIVVVLRVEDKIRLNELLGHWLKDSRLMIVYAKDSDKGMGYSLANGAESFLKLIGKKGEQYSGLLVMLGDMPYIAADTIQIVVDRYTEDKITYPCLDMIPLEKGWGHPVIFGKCWFNSLTELTGDKGARSIIVKNISSREEVIVTDENILRDVDTPDDLVIKH
ncbi:MAG: nucleotidyltransferase family protein [Cellvibrionaceae bacterium]